MKSTNKQQKYKQPNLFWKTVDENGRNQALQRLYYLPNGETPDDFTKLKVEEAWIRLKDSGYMTSDQLKIINVFGLINYLKDNDYSLPTPEESREKHAVKWGLPSTTWDERLKESSQLLSFAPPAIERNREKQEKNTFNIMTWYNYSVDMGFENSLHGTAIVHPFIHGTEVSSLKREINLTEIYERKEVLEPNNLFKTTNQIYSNESGMNTLSIAKDRSFAEIKDIYIKKIKDLTTEIKECYQVVNIKDQQRLQQLLTNLDYSLEFLNNDVQFDDKDVQEIISIIYRCIEQFIDIKPNNIEQVILAKK